MGGRARHSAAGAAVTARLVPLFRRWALVTRDSDGTATVVSSHYTERGATLALRNHNHRRRTWNERPRAELEPTDWGPALRQQMRVVQLLGERGATTPADLARHTAMSPRAVERVLLDLGRARWAVYRVSAPVGDEPVQGVWRLRSPQEWASDLPR